MTWRAVLAATLVTVAFWAPVAAASSIPDPTWVGGFYDGADGDELVALVWDRALAVEQPPVALAEPAPRRESPEVSPPEARCDRVRPASSRDPPRS